MPARKRFSNRVLEEVHDAKILGIRAGRGKHRFIGVWVVLVERRIFVRSWSVTPGGWYWTFQQDPRGEMEIHGRVLRVRAVRTRSERLKDAVSRAYLEKYQTPAARKYARDLGRVKSRAATIELIPR